jgi:hypothetical protein
MNYASDREALMRLALLELDRSCSVEPTNVAFSGSDLKRASRDLR